MVDTKSDMKAARSVNQVEDPSSGLAKFRPPAGVTAARFALPGLLVVFVVIFSVLMPRTFGTVTNATSILTLQSVLAILAIGTTLPLIIGEFDLSVGANLGLGSIVVTGFTSKQAMGLVPAILCAIVICTAVGVINGILVARVKLNAFVVTLATSTAISGAVLWYTNGVTLYEGVPPELLLIGQTRFFGLPLPILYLVIIGLIAWYVLDYTPVGRALYAIGGSRDASRLSGLPVDRLTVGAFGAAGLLAGLAGVLQAAELGSGSPTLGPSFLLPAYAAAFLGATSIRPGAFNIVGTVLAVITIAAGVSGLEQLGVPVYVEPLFTAAVLIIAVTTTRYLRRAVI